MVAAAVAVSAAASAATAAASSSSKSSANKKAAGQQQQAYQASEQAIKSGVSDARNDLQPFTNAGNTALQELAFQMGISQPQDNNYKGIGAHGNLMQKFDMDKYAQDPGYTPMVNSLEELQATPGYQFQLEQGLQSVNNSAAAKGSLLSGGQLKDLNKYAQGVASTGYQAAWDRAQQAYNNAFNRYTTNQNNTFNRLQSMANNGQAAATTQGGYSMDGARALSGAAQNNGDNQAQLSLAQGQNQAQLYNGLNNSFQSAMGYGMTSGGGGGSYFGGGSSYGGGTNDGINSAPITNSIRSYLG